MSSNLDVLYGQIPTPTETKSLIQELMASFGELLEQDKKQDSSWRLAEERCPSECRDEFKLIFLRCEVFRVKLAVKRYIRYWNNRLEVFGPDKAFLPILDLGTNGALKDNHKELKHGYVRSATPGTCQDPDGRAIFFIDGTKLDDARDDPEITVEGMIRATWYQVHAGLLSESAQRKGFVVLYRSVRSLKALRKSPAKSIAASIRGALPIRLAAIHIIDPPPLVSILIRLARSVIGKAIQNRMYVHDFESHEKILENLSKYGLDRNQLPNELGGLFDFKTVNPETVS